MIDKKYVPMYIKKGWVYDEDVVRRLHYAYVGVLLKDALLPGIGLFPFMWLATGNLLNAIIIAICGWLVAAFLMYMTMPFEMKAMPEKDRKRLRRYLKLNKPEGHFEMTERCPTCNTLFELQRGRYMNDREELLSTTVVA